MPKPDPALLDAARYPFSCRIEPRFGDLDVNMHINNVAIATILEDARVRFHHASGYRDGLQGATAMVASLAIEYLGQGAYPDPVTIHVAIESVGRTSVVLVLLAQQHGLPIAFSRAVMVTVGAQGPAALPADFAATAGQWMLRA